MVIPVHAGLLPPGYFKHKTYCSLLSVFLYFLSCFFLSVYSTSVRAVPPDISGSYSGTLSGSETCIPPGTGGSFTTTITFSITQNGGNFTGSGSFIDDASETGTFTFTSGVVNDSGVVSGNVNVSPDVGPPAAGTFAGTFTNGVLSLTLSNITDSGYPAPDLCITTSASGSFNRVSSADITVTPEITPSNVLTTPYLLNIQVKSITTELNTRIGDVLRGTAIGPRKTADGFMWQGSSTGLNAGDSIVNYGVWGSYSYSDFENDLASTAYDGYRHNFLAGVDISPWENTVLGVAFGYEAGDIDTGFNRGNQEIDGYTVAPYAGFLFSENWSVDASIGYSLVDSDQYRTDSGTRVTSSPTADRWFGTLNLNGFTNWNNWLFAGRLGMLYARNYQESFRESDGTFIPEFTTKLGQWNATGETAYSFREFEPFVRLTYEYDFSMTEIAVTTGPQPSNDNDNFLFGTGLRYFGNSGLSGNLEWNRRLGREDFREDIFILTLRKDF